mgnify:CR=1
MANVKNNLRNQTHDLELAECSYRLGRSCHSSKIPLIDTNSRGLKIISNCAFPTSGALDGSHVQCTVDADHSHYYDEGIWWLLPSNQNIFLVKVSSARSLYLKVNMNINIISEHNRIP